MAKDDAALKDQASEIDSIFKDGKKKPMNFALMKAKEGVVLKAHPLKSPDVMFRDAKGAGGMPAFSCTGVLNVMGKVMELSVINEDVPRTLPKLAKKHFSAMGIKCKVVIVLPGGERLADEDDEDGDDTDEVETEEVAPGIEAPVEEPDDGLAEALKERIKALVPQLRTALTDGVAGVEKLAKALQAASAEIANNALERAGKLVDAVEAGLQQAASAAPTVDTDQLKQQLLGEFNDLSGNVQKLREAAASQVQGKLSQISAMFEAEVERDLKKAGSVLSLMKNFVQAELGKLAPAAADRDPGGAGASTATPPPATPAPAPAAPSPAAPVATGDAPPAAEAEKSFLQRIADAVLEGAAKVVEVVKDNARLLAMAGDYPEAALAAKAAMDGFNTTLGGDLEITPEVLANAAADTGAAKTLVDAAETELAAASALPAGPAATAAVKAAEEKLAAAEAAQTKAEAFEKAAKGKGLLETAITTGPMSPGATRKMSPEAALELVKGAGRDPDLTAVAMEAAGTAVHPDAAAMSLGRVIDLKDAGFEANGTSFNPEYAAEYGASILKMGGHAGPDYFARMDDYMASGRQFLNDPTGEGGAATFGELEQKRSLSVGQAMIGPGGALALDTQGAKDALGDALFNPDTLSNARPALTAHMLETVAFLKDPANAAGASGILQGMPEPPTDPNAISLLQRANGLGPTDPVTKGHAQGAVMASMLKSLDQGPVGSCFSTAPTRRMRESDPLAAMGAYASIAGTGKYKPPFGPEVPVVTNTPPGDDPVMRSWEYSLATSTAQRGASNQRNQLAAAADGGMTGLTDAMKAKAMEGTGGLSPADLAAKQLAEDTKAALQLSKLKNDVGAAFTFIYDPMSVTGVGSDGSSDRGRYILQRISPQKDIRNQADFLAQTTEVALASLAIDPAALEATLVKDHIASPAFITAVTQIWGPPPKKAYLPWEMAGGGQTTEATQALHGDTLTENQMTGELKDPAPPAPRVPEGQRATEVLNGFMAGMAGKADAMVTVRTVGMHGFNALPNDPSLDTLKGATPEARQAALEANMLKPGEGMRDTDIPKEKALELYTAQLQPMIDDEADAAVQALLQAGFDANKPTAAMKPAALDAAIKAATTAARTAGATSAADTWKADEEAKGETITDADYQARLAKEQQERLDALEQEASSAMMNAVFRGKGAPEFVVADTNWGSGADHTFFVFAPDPATGLPALWMKTVPDGSLRKASRDWITAEWAAID